MTNPLRRWVTWCYRTTGSSLGSMTSFQCSSRRLTCYVLEEVCQIPMNCQCSSNSMVLNTGWKKLVSKLFHLYPILIHGGIVFLTVSGDSNFNMGNTGLTVGGFTQPSVARNIISNPSNSDKGLCQRFIWLIPKPVAVCFDQLQLVDKEFCTSIGKHYFIRRFRKYSRYTCIV